MSSPTKTLLPKFLNYEEDSCNNGYEAMLDFLISWTIRCSNIKFKNHHTEVYDNARTLVYFLIYGTNERSGYSIDEGSIPADFCVIEAITKRQKKGIDLIAEVTVNECAQHKNYILNIEHKFYSSLKDHQLKDYRKIIETRYKGQNIINLFITLDRDRKDYKREKELCEESNYKILIVGDIASYFKLPTGNKLFDMLWEEMC